MDKKKNKGYGIENATAVAIEPIKMGNNKFFNDFSSLNGLIDLEFGHYYNFFFSLSTSYVTAENVDDRSIN